MGVAETKPAASQNFDRRLLPAGLCKFRGHRLAEAPHQSRSATLDALRRERLMRAPQHHRVLGRGQDDTSAGSLDRVCCTCRQQPSCRPVVSRARAVPDCPAVRRARHDSSSRLPLSRFASPDILWTSYVPNRFCSRLRTPATAAAAWAPSGQSCPARPFGPLRRRVGTGAAVSAIVDLSRKHEKRNGR